MNTPSAAQLSNSGKQEFQAGNFLDAAQYFAQAAASYAQTGDELSCAEMNNNRSVALLQAGQPQAALDAASGTEVIFGAAGDITKQGMALGNQAAALEALGMTAEAITKYEQSAELFGSVKENELKTTTLQALSALQLRSGHQYEALASMQAALAAKKHLGIKERFVKKLLRVPFKLLDR